jgi:hypothetical protein
MAATLISCGAFVPLAVKWPLHTRRVSGIAVKALVTSNIIQSVCLVGKGRLKERRGLEPRTDFFLFKKSAKISADWIGVRIGLGCGLDWGADWIGVRIGLENIRYVFRWTSHAATDRRTDISQEVSCRSGEEL